MKHHLLTKIHDRTAVVAVVGLALRPRSGQALAVAFAEQGFPVTGIDVDAAIVQAAGSGFVTVVMDSFDVTSRCMSMKTQ